MRMRYGASPVHLHDYLRRRDVTDLAVQRQVHHRLVADIVDELVLARVPRERQAAAYQPFVETVEPAQAAPVAQVDVAWVDDLLNRRIPAQTHVTQLDIEHAHTAGRDHAKLQPTVVDLDQIDALLLAAVQSALVDRPAGAAPVAREIRRSSVASSLRECRAWHLSKPDSAKPPAPRPRLSTNRLQINVSWCGAEGSARPGIAKRQLLADTPAA